MNKKSMTAAVLAALSVPAATGYAAQNPFKDLPEGHWAYDAVTMLARDGVIEGYGDGTFRGDRGLNRYEMAELVSKAMEKYATARPADRGAIKKLKREFASELSDIDDRLTAVESDVKDLKKTQSSFKWFGDARARYYQNKKSDAVKGYRYGADSEYNQYKTRGQSEIRLRLGFYGEPAEHLSVTGQLKAESSNIARRDYDNGQNWNHFNGYDNDNNSWNKLGVSRLQLDWHAKDQVTVSVGRNELKLGQGLIYWENPLDSVLVRKDFGNKASILVGAGDTSPSTGADNRSHSGYAQLADLSLKVSPAVTFTATYFNSNSDDTESYTMYSGAATWDNGIHWWGNKNYASKIQRNFRQFAYGVHAQMSPKWSLTAEGIHNSAQVHPVIDGDYDSSATYEHGETKPNKGRNGFWTRLSYGKMDWHKANTWQVYGEYMALGGLAVDSSAWTHHLNVAGGNGYGGAGVRGWGLGVNYMLASNVNFEGVFYKLKPYDSNQAGFSDYKDTAFGAISYSF